MRSDGKNRFSQFLERLSFREKTVFQCPEPRLITLENYPENVIPFTASNIKEACLKADAAMRQDGIQGAVWIKGAPVQVIDFISPVNKLREKVGNIGYLHDSSMREMNGINLKAKIMEAKDTGEPICVLQDFELIPAEEILRSEIVDGLKMLADIFERCSLSSRFQLSQELEPHFDGSGHFPYIKPQEDNLFMGRQMRIISPANIATTIIFNTKGDVPRYKNDPSGNILQRDLSKLQEAWSIGFGDYLFSCNLSWGKEKALPHSPEAFHLEDGVDCREVDVFNVRGGIPLEQIEI